MLLESIFIFLVLFFVNDNIVTIYKYTHNTLHKINTQDHYGTPSLWITKTRIDLTFFAHILKKKRNVLNSHKKNY